MYDVQKFFCFNRLINCNFSFIVLLLIISRIDSTKTITSYYLRKNAENMGDLLLDNPIDTALLAMDSDVIENKETNDKLSLNNSPFNIGQEKYFAKGNCTEKNCLDPYGRCENKNVCACNAGYAQLPSIKVSDNQLSCTIALKSQSIFFGIEILTWIGVGHIYAGRWLYGFVKMSVFIFIILFDCLLKRCVFNNSYSAKNKYSIVIISYFLYAFFLLWQTVDIILIGSNIFRDGNGFKIMTWDK